MFFQAERQKFFRPLNSSRKELIAACLRALYEHLHGPAADYAHNLTRDSLKELLLLIVREHSHQSAEDEGTLDEFSTIEPTDIQQMTGAITRALLRDGWLEQFPDRQGLVTAFRLSRTGKTFAEAFWALQRPSRSRQRNMRGCRNALEAALSERGDAHDLVDAYEYAEKVIEDLNEGIDYLQERVSRLMQEASVHSQWDEFVEFLERFQRDYAKQLTADNATLNRLSIRNKLEHLRTGLSPKRRAHMEAQLHDIAQWAVLENNGASVYDWLVDRTEDIVNAACDTKQPGFVKAMETYLKRITTIVQQSMMLRTGQTRHAFLTAVQRVAEADEAGQELLLARIGSQIAAVEFKLLDPSSFKLRTATVRRKAVTISLPPRPTREARLDAALRRGESEVFAVANEDLAGKVRAELRLLKQPLRLSGLSTATARDVISTMQTVEAVRSALNKDMVARRLPHRVENDFFSGYDYEIDFKKKV